MIIKGDTRSLDNGSCRDGTVATGRTPFEMRNEIWRSSKSRPQLGPPSNSSRTQNREKQGRMTTLHLESRAYDGIGKPVWGNSRFPKTFLRSRKVSLCRVLVWSLFGHTEVQCLSFRDLGSMMGMADLAGSLTAIPFFGIIQRSYCRT